MSDKEKKLSIEQKNEISDSLNSFLKEIKSSSIDSDKKDQIEAKIWELEAKMDTFQDVDNLLSSIESELKVMKEYTEFKKYFVELKNKVENIEKNVIESVKNNLESLKNKVASSHWLDLKNPDPERLKEVANKGRKNHSKHLHNIASNISNKWEGFWAKIANLAENAEKFFG